MGGRLDYPSNFDTPAFPAGKRIAISRAMAIGAMVAFFIITILCFLLLWTARSQRIDPFIISRDAITGTWEIVGHSHGDYEYSATRTMQEAVCGNFVKNWFEISAGVTENESRWQQCDRYQNCMADSGIGYGSPDCAIYCATDDNLFTTFARDIAPKYRVRMSGGERVTVDMTSLQITPVDAVSVTGGAWRVQATLNSSTSGATEFVAYINIGYNTNLYTQTLGYYVTDFNAYRINQ